MNNHETSYQCHCYLLKRISRMHAILLWRFADDSLKFVDNSSVSAFANNADMRMCRSACVCVCVGAHMFFVTVRMCVLLERSFRQCRSSAFWMICRPLSCIYVALSFLLLPPSASSLSSESFVVDFPVCAWLLCCWVEKIKILNETDTIIFYSRQAVVCNLSRKCS